ncbi:MAG TPA: class I SAM-dependent methyltransferase [Geminicoccaceae bacterium]
MSLIQRCKFARKVLFSLNLAFALKASMAHKRSGHHERQSGRDSRAAAIMYSREEPGPRYRKLTELYRRMHVEGDRTIGMPSEQTFAGGSVLRHVPEIKKLIDETGAQTLLDYGAGKGHQYAWRDVELPNGSRVESLTAYWGVTGIALYDPGYEPLTSMPSGTFDGVICTDVLEHCPAEDIPWIIDELFGFACRFVYVTIAAYDAIKTLPNGENAHCTVRPPDWWRGVCSTASHIGIRGFATACRSAPEWTEGPSWGGAGSPCTRPRFLTITLNSLPRRAEAVGA